MSASRHSSFVAHGRGRPSADAPSTNEHRPMEVLVSTSAPLRQQQPARARRRAGQGEEAAGQVQDKAQEAAGQAKARVRGKLDQRSTTAGEQVHSPRRHARSRGAAHQGQGAPASTREAADRAEAPRVPTQGLRRRHHPRRRRGLRAAPADASSPAPRPGFAASAVPQGQQRQALRGERRRSAWRLAAVRSATAAPVRGAAAGRRGGADAPPAVTPPVVPVVRRRRRASARR